MMIYSGHPEQWGLIPSFLSSHDERDAVTQIDANYGHGGGWHDTVSKYEIEHVGDGLRTLNFAVDDEPLHELGCVILRNEQIVLFEHAYVAVIQPDGRSRVARID